MPFGHKSKLAMARPTKKVKIEGIATVLADVAIPDYRDYKSDDESFEFDTENKLDDPQENIQFLAECSKPLLKDDCFRQGVVFLFVNKFDSIDNTHNASFGKGGIRTKIRERLGLNETTKVDHIFNDVLACKKTGISYNGERRVGDAKARGQPPILSVESREAQIIADVLESRTSIPNACWLANAHRKETGEDSLCIAPVRNLIKRLSPNVTKIKKRC
jgi:hypothetical protein